MDDNYRHIEKEFLSPQECEDYIEWAEDIGFEEALIQVSGQGQVMNKDVRDNYRVILDSIIVARHLWNRMEHIAPEMEGWEPIGLNERIRFYRYEFGQQFKRHMDGPHRRENGERSWVTMIIYLNDDFDGGATQFIDPFQMVYPETGSMLLFKHRQLHQGDPVTKGTKYVMRTDIMYKKIEE